MCKDLQFKPNKRTPLENGKIAKLSLNVEGTNLRGKHIRLSVPGTGKLPLKADDGAKSMGRTA